MSNNQSQGAERRRFSRVDFHHELTLRNQDGKVFHGAFNDISLKGMLFWCEELPAEGDELRGAMPLGEGEMRIHGRVMRVRPSFGAAIVFENMDVESFSHLRRLVSLNLGDAERIDQEFFDTL